MERRNVRTLVIPPELYEAARRAALRASLERERTISVSEWIREAIEEKLAHEGE